MHKRWLCSVDVDVDIEAVTPVLVKSGTPHLSGPDMVPVQTFRGGNTWAPVLPGSSLKGALRSHAERIARTLRAGSVCLPYQERPEPGHAGGVDAVVGCGHCLHHRKDATSQDWYHYACAACRVFGSTKVRGRLSITDALAAEGKYAFEQRDGVAIDRFTGGASRGKLFQLQVVAAGSVFQTRMRLQSFESWQLGLLFFLLDDLHDERIPIGSGRSRGLGRVRAKVTSFAVSYLQPQERLVGARELLEQIPNAEGEAQRYGLSPWSPAPPPPPLPEPVRRGLRLVYRLDETWREHLEPFAAGYAAFLRERDHTVERTAFVAAGAGA